jgi:KDEL-tailed cysteine endopeptidase
MVEAFTYAEGTAMQTEASYPYEVKDGTCRASSSGEAVSKVGSFQHVKTNDPTALLNAIAEGPVSIAVDASDMGWQLYHGGIISARCGTTLDHGVLAVGYGTEQGTDYWLVKNCWGEGWGEQGYVKILREMEKNGPGVCGLQQ